MGRGLVVSRSSVKVPKLGLELFDRSVLLFIFLTQIANIPPSVNTDLMSAPVVFGHILAINSNLISLSNAIVLACYLIVAEADSLSVFQ